MNTRRLGKGFILEDTLKRGAHTDTPERFGEGHIDVPKKTDYDI